MNDSAKDGEFVEASSGLLLLFAGGAVVGPLIASAAMHFLEPRGLFLYTAFIHAAMAIFTIYRMRQRTRPLKENREPFSDSMRISQTVSGLDPLSEPDEEMDTKQP